LATLWPACFSLQRPRAIEDGFEVRSRFSCFGRHPTRCWEERSGARVQQLSPWTVGALANHIWAVAGEDERADVSATFIQPSVSYITKTKTTFGISSESTYDWENEVWSVPVNFTVAQLFKIGQQIMQSPSARAIGWSLLIKAQKDGVFG
jgi:hypothetical protein